MQAGCCPCLLPSHSQSEFFACCLLPSTRMVLHAHGNAICRPEPKKRVKREPKEPQQPTRASSRLRGEKAAKGQASELALFVINGNCPRCGKVYPEPCTCAKRFCASCDPILVPNQAASADIRCFFSLKSAGILNTLCERPAGHEPRLQASSGGVQRDSATT